MIGVVIVACEIGFWVFLAGGLTARYVWGRPRVGAALLLAAPLADTILLVCTVVDLERGATASVAHSLAAVYIGASLTYGHRKVSWADVRFAHRFAGALCRPLTCRRRGSAPRGGGRAGGIIFERGRLAAASCWA